jgi:hypothetical protein
MSCSAAGLPRRFLYLQQTSTEQYQQGCWLMSHGSHMQSIGDLRTPAANGTHAAHAHATGGAAAGSGPDLSSITHTDKQLQQQQQLANHMDTGGVPGGGIAQKAHQYAPQQQQPAENGHTGTPRLQEQQQQGASGLPPLPPGAPPLQQQQQQQQRPQLAPVSVPTSAGVTPSGSPTAAAAAAAGGLNGGSGAAAVGARMTLVLSDNGRLDLGGGVSFKIPLWYDDLAKTGMVPR